VYHIRKGTEDDHGAINTINRRAWAGGITTYELLEQRHGCIDGRRWSKQVTDDIADYLTQPDVTTFVAEQEGMIIGYATARIRENDVSDIGEVGYNAVDPDYRGQHVGTALIEQVIGYLEEQGARVLTVSTLESDEPARHIYERLGFKELTRFLYYTRSC
jgi:ribosomal-protein-alanine N-acetyltransferase